MWSKRGKKISGDRQRKRKERENLVPGRRKEKKYLIPLIIFTGSLNAEGLECLMMVINILITIIKYHISCDYE